MNAVCQYQNYLVLIAEMTRIIAVDCDIRGVILKI